ncbi:MAG: SPASM domain-containing protein [Planctomycetota bacterium]
MDREKSRRLMAYGDKLHVHVSWGGFDAPTWNRIMGVKKFRRRGTACSVSSKGRERVVDPLHLSPALPRDPRARPCGTEIRVPTAANWKSRGLPDYDSWAGKVSADALEAVGLVPRTQPYRRGACELLFTKPVVLADGRVNACACRDVEAELIVGDVRTPLEDLGGRHHRLIERHERGDYPDVCRRCPYFVSVTTRARRVRAPKPRAPTGTGSKIEPDSGAPRRLERGAHGFDVDALHRQQRVERFFGLGPLQPRHHLFPAPPARKGRSGPLHSRTRRAAAVRDERVPQPVGLP